MPKSEQLNLFDRRVDPPRKLVLELMQKHHWLEGNTPLAVQARWRVWRELHETYGYSLAATARATECNHTSIIHARDSNWQPSHNKYRRIPMKLIIELSVKHRYDTTVSISDAATQTRWNVWRDLHKEHGYTVNEISIALEVHRESVYNAKIKEFLAKRPKPPKNVKGHFYATDTCNARGTQQS